MWSWLHTDTVYLLFSVVFLPPAARWDLFLAFRETTNGTSQQVCIIASLKGFRIFKRPTKPRAQRIVGTLQTRRGYTRASLKNLLCEGLCPLWNAKDPGHWNSPLAAFNDVGSFQNSSMRILPCDWETSLHSVLFFSDSGAERVRYFYFPRMSKACPTLLIPSQTSWEKKYSLHTNDAHQRRFYGAIIGRKLFLNVSGELCHCISICVCVILVCKCITESLNVYWHL